jgi:hypothetical protein
MEETGLIIIEQAGIDPLWELQEELKDREDKWIEPYVEHPLSDMKMITLLTVMAWADEWSEIAEFARMKEPWLRRFLVLPHGIPSHDTIGDSDRREDEPGSRRNKTDRDAVRAMHQSMKRVALAMLSLVQSYYTDKSLKRIRFILSLGFEEQIETVFKLLNAQG